MSGYLEINLIKFLKRDNSNIDRKKDHRFWNGGQSLIFRFVTV